MSQDSLEYRELKNSYDLLKKQYDELAAENAGGRTVKIYRKIGETYDEVPALEIPVGRDGDIVSSRLLVFETDEAYEKYIAEHYPNKEVITLNYPIY